MEKKIILLNNSFYNSSPCFFRHVKFYRSIILVFSLILVLHNVLTPRLLRPRERKQMLTALLNPILYWPRPKDYCSFLLIQLKYIVLKCAIQWWYKRGHLVFILHKSIYWDILFITWVRIGSVQKQRSLGMNKRTNDFHLVRLKDIA